jgi:large conductance mechanosensitive channel
MWKDFKQFLLRGNVVDLAVGLVIGAAFTSVVNALVTGLITPLIASVAKVPNFSGLSFSFNGSTFMYGNLLNAAISFLLVAATVFFFIVKPMNILVARSKRGAPAAPTDKKCPECKSDIPIDAKRCKFCTQEVA